MKRTININDDIDIRVLNYINKYNLTYTSVVNIALHTYMIKVRNMLLEDEEVKNSP